MNNIYENSAKELDTMLTEEAVEEKLDQLSEDESKLVDILEDILDSSTLYIQDKESGSALVLEDGVNTKIFENVAEVSVNILEDIFEGDDEEAESEEDEASEDEDEESEESEEEDDEDEDEGEEEEAKEDYYEEEDEENEDDEEEKANESAFENEDEKIACQEAILNLLEAEELVIKSDLENEGIIINENSPYFNFIKESLIDRLIDTCETDEELEVCEEILSAYQSDMLESNGYAIDSINDEEKEELQEAGIAGIIKKSEKLKAKKRVIVPVVAEKGKKRVRKYAPGRIVKRAGIKTIRVAKKMRLIKKVPTKATRKIQKAAEKAGISPVELYKRAKVGKVRLTKYGLTKKGKVAAGLAAAGVGYGAYRLGKKLKKKRVQKEEAENSGITAGELYEAKISAIAKLGRKLAKAPSVIGKVVTKRGRAARQLAKKHPFKAALGIGALGGYALKKRKEKVKTAAYKRGVALASEGYNLEEIEQSLLQEGAKAKVVGKVLKRIAGAPFRGVKKTGRAAKIVTGLGLGVVGGRALAKRRGKIERERAAGGPVGYSKEVLKGYKGTLKGRKKVEKGKAKMAQKIRAIKGKYTK